MILGTRNCKQCGKEIVLKIKRDLKRKYFCSHSCVWKLYSNKYSLRPPKGTKESQMKAGETIRQKMRLGLIPKPPRPTPEMCIANGLKRRGSLHPKWIEDRTKLKLSRFDCSERIGIINSWRKDIYRKDNFTCVRCGEIGGNLTAHHILNWSEYLDKRYNVNNGITLCQICHKEFHFIYGRKANNQKQIEEFLNKEKYHAYPSTIQG